MSNNDYQTPDRPIRLIELSVPAEEPLPPDVLVELPSGEVKRFGDCVPHEILAAIDVILERSPELRDGS